MAKVRVEKLSLAEIDALVAKLEGVPVLGFTPSSSWSQGGPIIEDKRILAVHYNANSGWLCYVSGGYKEGPRVYGYKEGPRVYGKTMLVAAMRCLVKNTFGDYVDVAKELA